MESINFTAIAAILVTGALLMVPVLGLTLRLVVPPIVEACARARAIRSAPHEVATSARTQRRDAVRESSQTDEQVIERELMALHS